MRIRRVAVAVLAAGLVVIVTGACGAAADPARDRGAAPAARRGRTPCPRPTGPIVAPPQTAEPRPVARPVSLTIPLIGVHTRLITLGSHPGRLPAGAADDVRRRAGSPEARGQVLSGPAVIAGHIDSYRGPGVFFRLDELRPGNRVYVRRSDRTTVMFRVTAVHRYLKDHFPTQAVYGGHA